MPWLITYTTEEREESKMTQISAKGFRERVHPNPEPAQTKTQFLEVWWDLGPFTRVSRTLGTRRREQVQSTLQSPWPDQTAGLI